MRLDKIEVGLHHEPFRRLCFALATSVSQRRAAYASVGLVLPFVLDSKNASSEMGSELYDAFKFALKPFGASIVILTPFCNTETGNTSDG